MDSEYWLQRWRDGRTGWHHDKVMPLLAKHWPTLSVAHDSRVLVPLCGKSLDMLWLAEQGLRVLGADLSPIAIEAFLTENHLHARAHSMADGTHYVVTNPPAGAIELINGNVFDIAPATLATCHAFYDRAASIAMPATDRRQFADRVYAKLPAGARGLLITLDYPDGEMDGPPFSVNDAEVHRMFDAHWTAQQLERRDILASQPSFRDSGVTALHTAVYALTRNRA